MKRTALWVFAAVVLIVSIPIASAQAPNDVPNPPPEARCLTKAFRAWSADVWDPGLWERGKPPAKVIAAQRRRLACAPPGHLKAMSNIWRRDKAIYWERRHDELWREKVTPFFCSGRWWATECEIPLHESGYGSGGGNLYGMLDAWALHGCTAFAPSAWDASKRQQDICASRHWRTYGRGGWPSY